MTGIRYLARVGSTQDVIHALAAEGAEGGLAVVAAEQAEGRGSRRQVWHSPLGGLWLSFLWRPRCAPAVETLSVRVGLAVAEVLERTGIPAVQLKWPNDLMVTDRKAGGILCEARWQGDALGWVAVGVGLNVANPVPADVRQEAIALASVRPGLDAEALVEPVVDALRHLDDTAPLLSAAQVAAFARRDWLRGRPLAAPVAGIAAGLDADGMLRVQRLDGVVELLRTGPVQLQAER